MKSERLLTVTRPSLVRRYGRLIGGIGATAGLILLSQWQWLGYITIVAYAVIALLLKWPAHRAFLFGLAMLAVVPIATMLAMLPIAQNFAAYSFVLFAYGVVATTIELWRSTEVKK